MAPRAAKQEIATATAAKTTLLAIIPFFIIPSLVDIPAPPALLPITRREDTLADCPSTISPAQSSVNGTKGQVRWRKSAPGTLPEAYWLLMNTERFDSANALTLNGLFLRIKCRLGEVRSGRKFAMEGGGKRRFFTSGIDVGVQTRCCF